MPKQKLREKTCPAPFSTAAGRGLIAIGPGPKMQKMRGNELKEEIRIRRIGIRG